MRLSNIIVCLSFIGLKAHVMGEYLSVQQCVAQSTRSLAWPISMREDETVSLSFCALLLQAHTQLLCFIYCGTSGYSHVLLGISPCLSLNYVTLT